MTRNLPSLVTPSLYRRTAIYTLFAYWITRMMVGSRPVLNWVPWGMMEWGLLGVAGVLLVRAHRRKRYLPWEFQTFSLLCLALVGYLLAEAVGHLLTPQAQHYGLGSLMGIAVVSTVWLAEKQEAWFYPK